MTENELKELLTKIAIYMAEKGVVDISYREIKDIFESQETKSAISSGQGAVTYPAVRKDNSPIDSSPDKSNSIKDSLDKDYKKQILKDSTWEGLI
jgi:hypothetical protein